MIGVKRRPISLSFFSNQFAHFLQSINIDQSYHSCSIPNPTLVGISKATLDKSLGFAQFKWDFKNKLYTKRFNMHIIIIPEQIVENPNFKLILVVKE